MLLPTFENPTNENLSHDMPLFKEYAFDFDKRQFKTKDGRHYLVEGNEAIKIWIQKAFLTERYKYGAYSDDYGSELNSIIGLNIDRAVKEIEIRRYIAETLLVNPYILSVDNIKLDLKASKLLIDMEINTIYGKGAVSWNHQI